MPRGRKRKVTASEVVSVDMPKREDISGELVFQVGLHKQARLVFNSRYDIEDVRRLSTAVSMFISAVDEENSRNRLPKTNKLRPAEEAVEQEPVAEEG